jgi:hypothetical protein
MAFKLAAKKAAPAKKTVAKKAAPRRVEEDDEPTPTKKSASKKVAARSGVVTTGWGGAKEMNTGGDFIKSLDFKNEALRDGDTLWFLIKFLEDAPYANVKIHWISERKGKKSFVCIGDGCPLCDVGADVKAEFRFNVAMFTDTDPVVRSWAAGWKIYRKIESLSQSKLTSPLPKRTYLATRIGKNWNEMQYDIQKITDDEIGEAYPDIYIPSADEIAELTPYTVDDVEKEYSTIEELEEIAAEIVEGE